MSRTYTVKSGDTLGKISIQYYGSFSKWNNIVKANPQLAGRKTVYDGSPVIRPGDILLIPDEKDAPKNNTPIQARQTIVLDENAKKDLALYVDGVKFTGFTGYTVTSAVDTFDAFSFSSLWDSSNKECRDAFRPFTYKKCSVYYDSELIFQGVMLPAVPSISDSGRTISVQGYPYCGILSDSCLPDSLYPPEYNGLDLQAIAETVAEPFGVTVQTKSDVGDSFEKIEIQVENKVMDFLKKLAEQRGMFLSNTQDGSLLIWKPEEEKVSATFKEGEFPFVSCTPTFDGQNMYSHVIGFSKVEGGADAEKYCYENSLLQKAGVLRVYAKTIDDADASSLENATKAVAGRMFANSVKYELIVSGHRGKDGKLYRKNMSVSVYAPDAEIYRETKFQVDEVTMTRSDSDGEKTKFSLVLPGARDGKLPEVYPWEE